MIRRLIEIILDPDAAKKLEKDIKRTLDSGTKEGATEAEKNLALVERAMGRLKLAALRIGSALAAAFGVHKIVQFGRESVQAAMAAEAVWRRLEGQLQATGTAFSDVEAEVRAAARAMQDTTTIGDEEFAGVLTDLVAITGDYRASLAEVQTVADLAAAKQMDLSAAAKLVGKAMVGETAELKRYGIIVTEGADAMDALRERFRGMAENEAATLQGRVTMLKNEFGDLKEAIGDAMIEAGGGTSALDSLIGSVKGLTAWINENRSEIANWGRLVISTFRAVFESGRFMARMVVNAFDVLGAGIALRMLDVQQGVAKAVNFLIEGINHLPGVDIQFRMNEMTPQQFAEAQSALVDEIKADTLDMQDAVLDLAEAYRNVGTAAVAAATGQRAVASGGSVAPGASDSDSGGLSIPDVARRDVPVRIGTDILDAGVKVHDELTSLFQDANPFAGLVEQVDFTAAYMAEGFRGVGLAIVRELIGGRAEEQFASGLAALASGTWPPNPAALSAAGKHFAAAAAFKALGATVSGAISGGRGGVGGGVGGIPRGGIGTSVPGTTQVMPPELHVYLDPLSASDPRAQVFVAGAMQNATERYGPNVKIHVHSRT